MADQRVPQIIKAYTSSPELPVKLPFLGFRQRKGKSHSSSLEWVVELRIQNQLLKAISAQIFSSCSALFFPQSFHCRFKSLLTSYFSWIIYILIWHLTLELYICGITVFPIFKRCYVNIGHFDNNIPVKFLLSNK